MDDSIACATEYGILVRRGALKDRNITFDKLLETVDAQTPLDQNETLISFGPHFGGEALEAYTQALIASGLVYWDDFIDISIDIPPWLKMRAQPVVSEATEDGDCNAASDPRATQHFGLTRGVGLRAGLKLRL